MIFNAPPTRIKDQAPSNNLISFLSKSTSYLKIVVVGLEKKAKDLFQSQFSCKIKLCSHASHVDQLWQRQYV
jgi:hypothetical protein